MTAYRAGTSSDLAALVSLEAQAFGGAGWSEASVAGELAGVGTTRLVLVAENGEQLVGYAALMYVGDGADVQRVVVHTAHRRHGIAADLLSRLLDEAAGRGCQQVLLEVAADNKAALGLYKRFGFAEISHRPRYYGGDVDAVVMACHLGQAP